MIKRITLVIVLITIALIFTIRGQIKVETGDPIVFRMEGGAFDMPAFVVITDDMQFLAAFTNKMQETEHRSNEIEGRGVTFVRDGYPPVMWLPHVPSSIDQVSILNHELFHLTHAILDWAKVPLDDSSEEVYAYMIQYYTKQFYEMVSILQNNK